MKYDQRYPCIGALHLRPFNEIFQLLNTAIMAIGINLCMPGEGAPHSRVLTAWPDKVSQKNKRDLNGAELDVAAIANAIVRFEPVTLFCCPKNAAKAKAFVSPLVDIQEMEIDELWIRDTGPIYVKNHEGKCIGLDVNFNYWGAKYKGTIDSTVARAILAKDGIERVQAPFVTEGGAIEVDGEGTLLITESSIVNDNRNPGMTKQELEQQLKAALGVQKVIWLRGKKGLDITDGHIDGTARFVSPGKVLLTRPSANAEKVTVQAYEEAKQVLGAETDARGRKIEVLELREADPALFDGDPYETTLTYLNYLLVNGGVIIPEFGDYYADAAAVKMFKEVFPDRLVVPVRLNMLRRLGGGIHCATQQQPTA